MEAIVHEPPKILRPEPLHVDILLAVSQSQSCATRTVVDRLLSSYTERLIRAGLRFLLANGYLTEMMPAGGIVVRLTSKGRIFLQQAGIS